jgi:hypothetical protein
LCELKSDVGAATAVPLRTDERGPPPAGMQCVIGSGALTVTTRIVLRVRNVHAFEIPQGDDVVYSPFFHADAAAPIGSAPARGLDGVVRAERVQFAAGERGGLGAHFAARVERATGWNVYIGLRHNPYCTECGVRFPYRKAALT